MYGKAIKDARLEANKTQIEVSKATGIPQNTISWIELDKGIPNVYQCKLLADFYEISIEELIGTKKETKNTITYNNSIHNGDNKF